MLMLSICDTVYINKVNTEHDSNGRSLVCATESGTNHNRWETRYVSNFWSNVIYWYIIDYIEKDPPNSFVAFDTVMTFMFKMCLIWMRDKMGDLRFTLNERLLFHLQVTAKQWTTHGVNYNLNDQLNQVCWFSFKYRDKMLVMIINKVNQ